jgi:hypothetical protein
LSSIPDTDNKRKITREEELFQLALAVINKMDLGYEVEESAKP